LKGGVALSQRNKSCLRFSLEESVWFQRGQEVEELVSISLDPNITIQENDQYVTIRGSLDLTGEYMNRNQSNEENEQEMSIQKWVHFVEERSDGVNEFSHQFPVDITIPSNRVRDLADIDVIIDTFDYLLPERSCLKLTAELNILGLYGDEASDRQEDRLEVSNVDDEEEEMEIVVVAESPDYDDDSFEVEAKKEEQVSEPTLVESSSYQQPVPEISFAAFRSEQQPVEMEEAPILSEEMDTQVEKDLIEEPIPTEEYQEEATPVVTQKAQKKSNKKSMSIAEFLARKESEDDHAKLKVCIVQHGETINTLADRYDINVQQLLKVNHLELNQDVHEGQVLYIPNSYVKK
jgi:stage VI sporulation protein D